MTNLARLMLDHCPDMMILVNPADLHIKLSNASACTTLGYEPGQLQGMVITDVESDLQDLFYWQDVQGNQFSELVDQESLYRRRDGELLAVRKSVHLVHSDSRPMLLVRAVPVQDEHVVEDTLARTLSELRATLESTGNGILVLDWHGKVNSMNRLFGEMWAFPPDMLNWQDDGRILNFIVAQVQEPELMRDRLDAVVHNAETHDLLHHGDGRVMEVSSRPQFLYEQIIGRVYSFQDITERTLAERALRESRDLLEHRVLERTADLQALNERLESEKQLQGVLIRKLEEAQNQLLQSERMASIGQLAAGVAHEINNPVGFVNSNMGSLQGYINDLFHLISAYEQIQPVLSVELSRQVSLVRQEIDIDFLRDDVPKLMKETTEGLQRVTRIVQDLKNFSHVDEAERQFTDIEAGLESTLRVVWNELKYKSDVVKEYGGIPPIECFPFQLNQVFMNLLVNASHAIETHGTITLRTGQDASHVWIEIQDTGKGIQPEHMGRIFEPFFTTKPVGKGTGLGLSVAYGIVQRHHGKIDVRSDIGKGSTFRVTLPLKQPESIFTPAQN